MSPTTSRASQHQFSDAVRHSGIPGGLCLNPWPGEECIWWSECWFRSLSSQVLCYITVITKTSPVHREQEHCSEHTQQWTSWIRDMHILKMTGSGTMFFKIALCQITFLQHRRILIKFRHMTFSFHALAYFPYCALYTHQLIFLFPNLEVSFKV